MLDIEERDKAEVLQILNRYLPDIEVRAFGSRVTGRAGKFSDLDLVAMTMHPLTVHTKIALQDSFSDSNLPFTVDIVDWASADENFRIIIQNRNEIIQEALKG
jgi:predicted nucleotidyltransferase